ncbi:hypothetical protein DAEQUDRAFT_727138 [Daedalea quercina L-15889]|uniref:G domain-containing protein n=1 Tax=Daedalea quercina L-15889 TaxID=1314783 RepID=A0A165Q3J7_9APHY|nr:hypothetical protein DAEQUDRAFT_727138 [Daedalea quercina L-15889]
MAYYKPAIFIMGPSGTGKTRFTNLATGRTLFEEGTDLETCTTQVQSVEVAIDGRQVEIFDTPGLDSDEGGKVKADLVRLFCQMYKEQRTILGIVYMHDISQIRIGKPVAESYKWLLETCGYTAMRNVVIVTNMWIPEDPARIAVGQGRERELRYGDPCYMAAFDNGALLLQHNNTTQSALAILRQVVRKEPVVLRCQRTSNYLRDEQDRQSIANTESTCVNSVYSEKPQTQRSGGYCPGGCFPLLRRHRR